jgi:hypothetical protein
MLCRKLAIRSIGVSGPLFRRLFLVPSNYSMSSRAAASPPSPPSPPTCGARPVNTASAKPVPEGFSSVSEGSASIIHETGHVFYNPAQVQNRDLSIACLNVFSKIYRQEKEARAAKRSSRHSAEAIASTGTSPVAAGGDVAPADVPGEYKGLRILEGTFLLLPFHIVGSPPFRRRLVCIWATFHTLRQRNP